MNLTPDLRFDTALRWIDDLPDPAVPDYIELDARLAWRATPELELAIVATNLLHGSHPETSAQGAPDRIRRGVFVDAILGF
jgi:iron complex outermembrane receptor protein